MEQSGNLLAANITRILFARARESSRFTGDPVRDSMLATIGEHKAILDAIVAGDEANAATCMHEHISRAWARRRPPSPPLAHERKLTLTPNQISKLPPPSDRRRMIGQPTSA